MSDDYPFSMRHCTASAGCTYVTSRPLWFCVLFFLVCGSYIGYSFIARPFNTPWPDDCAQDSRGSTGCRKVTASTTAAPQSPVKGNSSPLSRIKAELNAVMHSRLQRAKAYRTALHQELEAARRYLADPHHHRHFLTCRPPHGGIGNFMFTFATLLGCARNNHRIPLRVTYEPRMAWFEGMDIEFVNQSLLFPNGTIEDHTIGELGPGRFTSALYEVNARFPTEAAAISGYGQSWKYLHNISTEIRSMFTLTKPTQSAAITAIMGGVTRLYEGSLLTNVSILPLRVGIHVRRGDMAEKESQLNYGHTPATAEYLLRAVLHVQNKYQHALFFVISDDVDYCRKLFREWNFVFVGPNAQEVDMAIMTFMDVMVISVGSYGWWGAYLAEAREVFYFKDWPRPGSAFHKGIVPEDYFFPHWQGGN